LFFIYLQVIDINEAPADILLSSYSIIENAPSKTIVGRISVQDPDNTNTVKQSHTCRLTDNAQNTFEVSNNAEIRVVDNTLLDYERSNYINVFIECKDSGVPSLSLKKQITITVQDVNEKPTGITISKISVAENEKNEVVGTLRGIDPDKLDQKFRYTLMNELDVFVVNGSKVLTKIPLNYETRKSYRIGVKVIDHGGKKCFLVREEIFADFSPKCAIVY